MKCPFCYKQINFVINSRPTKLDSQIWRRRKCTFCKETFTTHEIIDLSHLVVVKKSGKHEKFSRIKLFSGIYGATIGSKIKSREYHVDKVTREVENDILTLRKKLITSQELGDIVLKNLKKLNATTFLRFLAYHRNIQSESQIKKELARYIEFKG